MWVDSGDGVRIGYEVIGRGRPLVLLHGQFGDRSTWHAAGYVDALAEHARLILIDGRGHGESDAPHEPSAYALGRQLADVLAVLDAVGVEEAAVWGSSMGGTVGLHLLAGHPGRVSGLIATGAHGEAVDAPEDAVADEVRTLRTDGVEPILAEMPGLTEWFCTAALASDPYALAALTMVLARRDAIDGVSRPVLLLAGQRDPRLEAIRTTAARLSRATLVELPGCGHLDAFTRADLTVPPVLEFLSTGTGRRGFSG
jgi:pimeloyl-ACP methyl ester carboxylesterase